MDHVGIAVSNLERSLAFYQGQLGFEVVERIEVTGFDLTAIFIRLGSCVIELLDYHVKEGLQRAPANIFGLRHLTILVDDMEKAYAELSAKGVTFTRPPLEVVPSRVKNAFLADPDGTPIELLQHL